MDYDPSRYPAVAVAVDLAVLTIRGDALCALVVRRGEDPFRGRRALPGGFVRPDEDLDAAAARELAEETGVAGAQVTAHLEQLASYGAPDRDPRMRVVTVAYLALVPVAETAAEPTAGGDAAAADWEPVAPLLAAPEGLAYDHGRILADAVERARGKLEYAPLATAFCPETFTVADLRRVYEIVWGARLDPRNFHRKVTGVEGFLTPTGATTAGERGRPAAVYRAGPARRLHPPMLRP